MRDFLPRAAARRRALAADAIALFEAWGYARLVTPMFEHVDVLERGLGDGARAAAIRFVEPGTGEIVALRPDITPQIARVVATRLADVPGPLRLCYDGAVMRLAGERGQREILQAGIELIDASEPDGDAEVLALAAAALARLAGALDATRLDVGHVAPARHVLAAAPDPDTRRALVAAISRKDRAGVRVAARALPAAQQRLAEALVDLWGPAPATLARAAALPWPPDVLAAFDVLRAALAGLAELAGGVLDVTADFGDLRGEGYYTGVRFAAYAAGAPEAILRGGRYDELIGRYGRAARATGFAIDLEAVAEAHRAHGAPIPASPPGVAIAIADAGAAAIARELRARGVRAVVQRGVDVAWLRGAGLDHLLTSDRLIAADGASRAATVAISAARAGDIEPLLALLSR